MIERLALAVLCTLVLGTTVVHAQSGSEESEGLTSPRETVETFQSLARRGRYREAARLLDLSATQAPRGEQLASRLDQVLGARTAIDLDDISDQPEGRADDGLSSDQDEIAQVAEADGEGAPIRLTRTQGAWRFSRSTVGRIDAWFTQLESNWILEYMPPMLLRLGPYGLSWWQWIALPALAGLAWFLGNLLGRICSWVFVRISRRTPYQWDDAVASRLRGPFTLWFALALFRVAASFLELRWSAHESILRVLSAGFLFGVFWALSRGADVAAAVVARSPWSVEHHGATSLVPLGARVVKLLILAIGVVTLLSHLGYPVASLLAGLGIGGLAVALAAQKTVENLLGAFSLGADQPFREGDFVRIEDFVGTVEKIGLRSTRVRTLDRTLVTLPNGRLADMRLESFAARDRLRLACTVGLVYATRASQMQTVLSGMREVLRKHPKIWPDSIVVRFKELGASSLDIEVMAWFETRDWAEFQAIREEVLLAFMKVVEEAGTSFAFPSRSIYLESVPTSMNAPSAEPRAPSP